MPVTRKNLLLCIGALLPPFVMLVIIVRFAVDVPFWDEWDYVPVLIKARESTLAFTDLWAQHNESRPLLLRLIMILLASITRHNILANIYCGFAFQCVLLAFVWRLLKITLLPYKTSLVPLLTIAVSLFVFSTIPTENWIWGVVSMQWFLSNLLAVVTVWGLARWPGRWTGTVIAFCSMVFGVFVAPNGLPLWGVGFLGLTAISLYQRRIAWLHLLLWIGLGGAVIIIYFLGYSRPNGHPDLFLFLYHPLDFVVYILSYLGSPFKTKIGGYPACAVIGFTGVAVLGVTAYWVGRHSRSMLFSIFPWLLLSSYVICNSILTAIGRLGFGVEQATASRYKSTAMLFWICLGVAISMLFTHVPLPSDFSIPKSIAIPVLSLFVLLYLGFYISGYRIIEGHSQRLTEALPYVYEYQTAPQRELTIFYPDALIVRDRAKMLQSSGLSPFSKLQPRI